MIRIGTGGYNHREWIGSFYPMGMGPARYLARYAEEFNACELQLSSYRMLREADAERILGESDGRIIFTARAPIRLVEAIQTAGAADLPSVGAGFLLGEGSPEIRGRDFKSDARSGVIPALERSTHANAALDRLLVRLCEALRPYVRVERFGGLVLPLPASVMANEETLAAIARVYDRLEGLSLLIEPRDASWANAQVLDFLRGVGLGFVLADGPGPEGPSFGPDRGGPRPLPARQLVTFVPLTGETAYVRFQGRDGNLPGVGISGGKGRRGNGPLSSEPPRSEDRRHVGAKELREAWERGGFHPAIRRHGTRERGVSSVPGASTDSAEATRHRSASGRMGSSGKLNPVGFPSAPSSYFYSWEELVGWLPTLRALATRAKDLYIVFDNPGRGSALENARMLSRLMGTVQPEATGS